MWTPLRFFNILPSLRANEASEAIPNFVIPAKAGIQNVDPSPKVLIGDLTLAPRLKHSGATKNVDSGMTLCVRLLRRPMGSSQ